MLLEDPVADPEISKGESPKLFGRWCMARSYGPYGKNYGSSSNDSDFESDASSVRSDLLHTSDSDDTYSNIGSLINSDEGLNENDGNHDELIEDEVRPASSPKVLFFVTHTCHYGPLEIFKRFFK